MLPTLSTATPGLALFLTLYALTGQRGGTRCLGDIGKEAEACSRQSGTLHLAFTQSRVCTPALPRFSPHTDEVRQTFPTQAAKKGMRGGVKSTGNPQGWCWKRAEHCGPTQLPTLYSSLTCQSPAKETSLMPFLQPHSVAEGESRVEIHLWELWVQTFSTRFSAMHTVGALRRFEAVSTGQLGTSL